MIVLVTGLPGHGKTLFAVSKMARTMVQSGRPVYSNINGLRADLGVHPLPAAYSSDFIGPISPDNFVTAVRSWASVPSGSIVVIDECQHGFPPRSSGSAVPPYIRAFETHRHFGLDVWLITQHPRFIDLHLARLVDTHFHVERFGGLSVSTVREYAGINFEPAAEKLRSDGLKTRFRFRKQDFALYQSAVDHFVKVRLPVGKLAVLLLGPLVAVFFAWIGMRDMFSADVADPLLEAPDDVPSVLVSQRPVASVGNRSYVLQGGSLVVVEQ